MKIIFKKLTAYDLELCYIIHYFLPAIVKHLKNLNHYDEPPLAVDDC